MEKAGTSSPKFKKWDKLIVDMEKIPDVVEPDKMRILLPHLDTKRNSEMLNLESYSVKSTKAHYLEECEEFPIGTDEIVQMRNGNCIYKDTVISSSKEELNDNKLWNRDMELLAEKENLSIPDDSPLRSNSPSHSSFQSQNNEQLSIRNNFLESEKLPKETESPILEIIDDTIKTSSQSLLSEDLETSNWLERIKKQTSWSDTSHKRRFIDDSGSSSGHSQSTAKVSRPKRGKYPWEMVKQDGRCKTSFRTAADQLLLDNQKKCDKYPTNSSRSSKANFYGVSTTSSHSVPLGSSYGAHKRSLGARRAVGSKFTPPVWNERECDSGGVAIADSTENANRHASLMADDRLKNIEARMVELIMNEILEKGPSVEWSDIAGLETAKTTIQEIVVWPILRPDIFSGLRGPPKGILLFGPPGTGKTLIGKCIASQSESTFFSISAASLTSKWIGEGEKMVRALFAVAKCHQPAVIFMDEIDALLSQRSETEHESSRRMKTEFLVQLDGATCDGDERILVVGATNRPQELDEAARRRLVKRLYIPLPNMAAREHIIRNLLRGHSNSLEDADIKDICSRTDGYSGADMANLCREAALGPIRSIGVAQIKHISLDEVRAISADDFRKALTCIRASVSETDLCMYEEWNNKYGIALHPSINS